MAVAGAPICCDKGNTACLGSASVSMALPADNLFSAGCTPPILNVFTVISFNFTYFEFDYASVSEPQLSPLPLSEFPPLKPLLYSRFAAASPAGTSTFGLRGGKLIAWIAPFGHSDSHLRQDLHLAGSMYAKLFPT